MHEVSLSKCAKHGVTEYTVRCETIMWKFLNPDYAIVNCIPRQTWGQNLTMHENLQIKGF